MAIKDLLIAFNGSPGSLQALKLGLQMAKKYEAAITLVHVRTPETFESHIQRWIPKETLGALKEAEEQAVESIHQSAMDEIAASGGGLETQWIVEEGHPNSLLARMTRYHDLLIIGQFAPVAPTERLAVTPEELVMRSGKPVLMVPKDYAVRPFKEHAVVAWDGSRPAARALSDAMQILETKSQLDIVTVADLEGEAAPEPPVGRDIVVHLKRHGVNAERVYLSAKRDGIGATLLEHCAEKDPDILVMGAYSQAKLREALFGGVTRDVLANMNVPVLMAH